MPWTRPARLGAGTAGAAMHLLATGVIYITFLPAYAVLSALIYYRLTAARTAAGLS